MDFGVRPQDKIPKSRVAHCKLSPSQENENEQIQNQIHAHLFFFDSQWIIHNEFVPPGQTVNKTFYRVVLERLRKRMAVCDQVLHALGCCTTTTPHVTRQSPSMKFWQKKAFLWFLSPPIRRISVPVNSFYSPGSKTTWKCPILVLWIPQKSVTDELKGIPAEAFQHCYEQWKQRLRRCVAAQGNYFEEKDIDL